MEPLPEKSAVACVAGREVTNDYSSNGFGSSEHKGLLKKVIPYVSEEQSQLLILY